MNNKNFFNWKLGDKDLLFVSTMLSRVALGNGDASEFKKEAEDLLKNLYEQTHSGIKEETFSIIEVKTDTLINSCYACPTIYEWEDTTGKKYYFRLRHGHWKIVDETNNSILVSGNTDDGADGCCNWKDVVRYAKKENVILEEL